MKHLTYIRTNIVSTENFNFLFNASVNIVYFLLLLLLSTALLLLTVELLLPSLSASLRLLLLF
jgi:hypothetical protein